jgi:UDPglucose--hexose-1-phosphate uridylyltransferase
VHRAELIKPDGRLLTLYANHPLTVDAAPSPFAEPLQARPHMRWHPLRGEWVTYAAYRQDRTFLPPPQYNPLAVTVDREQPTELPNGNWDIAVFDNRFPSLTSAPGVHPVPELFVPSARASGHCEVVVYARDQTPLGRSTLAHIELLFDVLADRTATLARWPEIKYVLPFENRGAEVGVTLHHPHGQIYAYPVIPPVPARMQELAAQHYASIGRGALQDMIDSERRDARRIVYEGTDAIAFVPVCARYPYEVWVAPIQPVRDFSALSAAQSTDLARALKTVLLKYDGLWERPFPYLMAWYQAPTDGEPHPESHLHAQFFPPYRTRDRLKYLAGTEIAAGFFAMDALPEDKARELQRVKVTL